jgi:hypothetical protein
LPSLKKCFLILLVVTLASCRSGKIPCPDIGGSNKLAFLNKLTGAGNGSGAAMGERVTYDKNGLLKKKKYKYLRNKPRRKKYKN